jgi:hypothetical protein
MNASNQNRQKRQTALEYQSTNMTLQENDDDPSLDQEAIPASPENAYKGYCTDVGFFCKNSFRGVQRSKCHFTLAFCAVFIVVLSSLVI